MGWVEELTDAYAGAVEPIRKDESGASAGEGDAPGAWQLRGAATQRHAYGGKMVPTGRAATEEGLFKPSSRVKNNPASDFPPALQIQNGNAVRF